MPDLALSKSKATVHPIAFSPFTLNRKSETATSFNQEIHVIDMDDRHPYITLYDSKAVLKTVNRRLHSKSVRQHATFTRVLSLLLLGFIVYGTTVEAVHKHGKLVSPVEVSSTTSISDQGLETASNTPIGGCNDCLICQLHQQFSTTLTSNPPSIDQSVSNSFFSSLTLVSAGSRSIAPSTGRAPPHTS